MIGFLGSFNRSLENRAAVLKVCSQCLCCSWGDTILSCACEICTERPDHQVSRGQSYHVLQTALSIVFWLHTQVVLHLLIPHFWNVIHIQAAICQWLLNLKPAKWAMRVGSAHFAFKAHLFEKVKCFLAWRTACSVASELDFAGLHSFVVTQAHFKEWCKTLIGWNEASNKCQGILFGPEGT